MDTQKLGEAQAFHLEGNCLYVLFPEYLLRFQRGKREEKEGLKNSPPRISSISLYHRFTQQPEAGVVEEIDGYGRLRNYGFWTGNGTKQKDLGRVVRAAINCGVREYHLNHISEQVLSSLLKADLPLNLLSNDAYPPVGNRPK